ncbi:MAG: DUF389 domain-containing protein [Coriobacteriales bacterium]|nr:DUF389 domain-containing protein [Coriobacteriales bacterium]
MDLRATRSTLRSFFNLREGKASQKTIRRRIEEGARIDGIHMCQLIAAMLIASIGLNVNSTEAVIGAMLVCPLMGSVLAISYAVASVDKVLLRQSAGGLFVQTVVCLLTSTMYFVLSPLTRPTAELLANSSPTVWDVLIALVGGFAGALGSSRNSTPSTLIAGVAVATALMPPLCSTGFGLAVRDVSLALSAFYEYLINVLFIAFGAEIVLVLLRTPLKMDVDGDGVVTEQERELVEEESKSLRRRLVVGSMIFALPCIFFSYQMVVSSLEETGTTLETIDLYQTEMTTLELGIITPKFSSYRIGTEDSFDTTTRKLKQRVVATVETTGELSEDEKKRITELIRLHVTELDEVSFVVAETTQSMVVSSVS